MIVASRLMAKLNVQPVLVIGLVCTAASLWFMTKFTVDVTQATITWTGFLQGMGLGFIFVSLSTVAFATLPGHLRTEAASIFALVRNIGSSLGISIVVSQLADNLQREHAVLSEHVSPFNSALSQSLTHGAMITRIWDTETPQGLAALNGEVMRQAAQIAYVDDFQIIMLMALATIPFAVLLRAPPKISPSTSSP
jgi:DHA2 family multidrug resistance protein